MKSSGPVFTKQNPFQRASKVGKTYYHPSCNQSLSQKKKNTTLSPVRLNQQPIQQLDSVNPEDQEVHGKDDHCFASEDGKTVYKEYWPSTDWESPSASSTTLSDMLGEAQSARTGTGQASSEDGVQQDSVLAKYVERFRYGRPQSREERQMTSAIGETALPFWWISASSLPSSSTPTKQSDKVAVHLLKEDPRPPFYSQAGPSHCGRALSPCRTSLSILADTSQGEFDDTDILHLQERANRLLLRDDIDQEDGSIHVSSEGLGCSDLSSPLSIDEPIPRPLISAAKVSSNSVQALSSQKPSIIPSPVPPTRPEEDILFQWRLRRKMEQARDWPLQRSSVSAHAFSLQAPSSSKTTASGWAYQQSLQPSESLQKSTNAHIRNPKSGTKEDLGSRIPSGPPLFPALNVSDSSVSQPQAIAHVPAHMHLLCDVLPCHIRSSDASTQKNLPESPGVSQTAVVYKNDQVPRNPIKTANDELICEPMSSPPSSGAAREERLSHHRRSEKIMTEIAQTKDPEKSSKEAAKSLKKQKKSTRYAEGRENADGAGYSKRKSPLQRFPKKILPLAKDQQHDGHWELSSNNAQPASPVHSALGQVVSQVLFPTADSSPTQMTSGSSVSTSHTCSAPSQSSVHPGDEHNSVEVISQLLQEAEDSDEKEFEDDALLQVLRRQRKWVQEQIREVDSLLNDVWKSSKVPNH